MPQNDPTPKKSRRQVKRFTVVLTRTVTEQAVVDVIEFTKAGAKRAALDSAAAQDIDDWEIADAPPGPVRVEYVRGEGRPLR